MLSCRYDKLRRICIVQIQPRNHVLLRSCRSYGAHPATGARQYTSYTSGIKWEYIIRIICPRCKWFHNSFTMASQLHNARTDEPYDTPAQHGDTYSSALCLHALPFNPFRNTINSALHRTVERHIIHVTLIPRSASPKRDCGPKKGYLNPFSNALYIKKHIHHSIPSNLSPTRGRSPKQVNFTLSY